MPDNLKINLELTVDGKSRKVDIDKVAANAENAAEARQQSEVTSENSREGVQGLLRGLEKYASEATNAAEQVEEAFKNAFKNIEDQLVRLITKGKFSLKQFLSDLAADTARAVIRIGVTGPIAHKLGTALRGRLGLPAPGGPADMVTELKELDKTCGENVQAQMDTETRVKEVVGECAKLLTELQTQSELLDRIANCSCGADAQLQQLQQFQVGNEGGGPGDALRAVLGAVFSGGAQGRLGQEMLTPLASGETVLALAQGAGGLAQQVQVVVENRGATQQEVVEQRAEADGGRLVVNVALDDIARRGPLSQALEQAYSLGRRTG